jgi:leucyl-tRNA synthetase
LEWADSGVEGASRFLRRVWNFGVFIQNIQKTNPQSDVDFAKACGIADKHIIGSPGHDPKVARREVHLALKQANFDLTKQQFNTVVSAAMKLLNALEKLPVFGQKYFEVIHEGFSILLRLLSPICPHITHQLWKELGYGDDILNADWPVADESAMVQDTVEYVVQVNGKLRGNLTVSREASKDAIEKMTLEQVYVTKFLTDGTSVRKIIVVPNKLVNVVIS